jgi:hypothetical protein
MGKKIKQGKWVMLMLALAVWCPGCSDNDGSTTSSNLLGNFHPTPDSELQARIAALKKLLPEETYHVIISGSRNNQACRESNREALGLPDTPNGQWYYTYQNLIEGMAEWKEFANEGDENTRKLEIAAFLANIAQETGTHDEDPFGGPGCAIQEGYGSAWKDCRFGGCTPEGIGYAGRGPHQLTYDYNYKAFGEAMGEGDAYLNNPDLLTQDPKIGIAGSIWFWGHEDLGWNKDPAKPFKPSAHDVAVGNWTPTEKDISCGRTDANFGVIINIINGGVECCKCIFDSNDPKYGTKEKAKDAAKKCCSQGCLICADPWGKDPDIAECKAWSCCDSIDCISEDCKAADERATNRVKYLQAIAEEMGVTIPNGFDVDCRGQLNFSNCLSY